jgi:hypothetical protein
MALQRITLRLTELRCIRQSEGSDGSEPYLWVTYFAFGAQQLPFQDGPMATITPAYDAFRTEFADNVEAGDVLVVPPFLAEASFDMDLDTRPKLVGCLAVLMEEDETPQSSIVLGRIAYSKEIDAQLNALLERRILAGDVSDISDEEIEAIRVAVKAKVEEAVMSNQPIWSVFTQDDNVGFTHRSFLNSIDPETDPEIVFQYFDFPEIKSDDSSNRFVLSGALSIGPVPSDPVDLCASQRAALNAKKEEVASLQARVTLLQNELHHATPQQKPAIIDEIEATQELVAQAEAEVPPLQAALDACIEHFAHDGGVHVDPTIVVDSG